MTIKNVTEEEKKKGSLIGFLSAYKINNYNAGAGRNKKRGKKSESIYRASQKKKNSKCFSCHCCQSPFPLWESQSTSPLWDALQHCADLWTCRGGRSDSNLVPPLCVLASTAHSCQSQCVSSAGALSVLLHAPQTQRLLADPVGLLCSLYSWWDALGPLP